MVIKETNSGFSKEYGVFAETYTAVLVKVPFIMVNCNSAILFEPGIIVQNRSQAM